MSRILTPAWSPVRERDRIGPTGVRASYRNDDVRFKIAAAGRRSTKTLHAKRILVERCTESLEWNVDNRPPWWNEWPHSYFYGAPTQDQANAISWEDLKKLIPTEWVSRLYGGKKPVAKLKFGVEIHVVGLDEARRFEGKPWNGGVLDEFADYKPTIWEENIIPILADRNAWLVILGVPDFAKPNNIKFKELFDKGATGTDPEFRSYSWPSTDVLDERQIAMMRENMSPPIYRQEVLASWETAPGRAYAEFARSVHVKPTPYIERLPLFVSCDFNRGHHNWGIYQFDGEKYRAPDEVYLQGASVQDMCRELERRIEPYAKNELQFYGDYSGDAERAEATDSAWQQIKNHFKKRALKPKYLYAYQGPIIDRVNLVNAYLRNADNEVRTEIDPKCFNLIRDLEQVPLKLLYSNGKSEELSHASDNFGYMLSQHSGKTRSREVAKRIRESF